MAAETPNFEAITAIAAGSAFFVLSVNGQDVIPFAGSKELLTDVGVPQGGIAPATAYDLIGDAGIPQELIQPAQYEMTVEPPENFLSSLFEMLAALDIRLTGDHDLLGESPFFAPLLLEAEAPAADPDGDPEPEPEPEHEPAPRVPRSGSIVMGF